MLELSRVDDGVLDWKVELKAGSLVVVLVAGSVLTFGSASFELIVRKYISPSGPKTNHICCHIPGPMSHTRSVKV